MGVCAAVRPKKCRARGGLGQLIVIGWLAAEMLAQGKKLGFLYVTNAAYSVNPEFFRIGRFGISSPPKPLPFVPSP